MVVWIPICFAAREQLGGESVLHERFAPLSVKPPDMTLRPWRYFPSSSAAFTTETGMPFVTVHVSGLWQYRHRHMHPVVHATTRTPGPSTVEPVVNEWRNPMSPLASASRTVCSGRSSLRWTRELERALRLERDGRVLRHARLRGRCG